ncbi:MAG: response regulator [Gilvibacter sp.]
MKPKRYHVLIIDDHPLISEAYKSAFNKISNTQEGVSFAIDVAHNCDMAFDKIKLIAEHKQPLDYVFLDIRLPPSTDAKILSGEDLGLKIRQLLPKARIVVSTTFNDNYRIHSIFKSIDPDGFLIKNDITPEDLVDAIQTVLTDPPYYSKTVTKLLRKEVSNDFLLDNIDRQLIYELSIGTKMKNLPEILPLSIAGIEKRKRHLKQIFNVIGEDDKELIQIAKDKGFV